MAVLSSCALVIAGAATSRSIHSYLGALPLLFAGCGYAVLQSRLSLDRKILLRRLVLAAAFVGWAADEMLPEGRVATFLGDLVIFAFVLDVFWMIRDQINARVVSDHTLGLARRGGEGNAAAVGIGHTSLKDSR